MCIVMAPIASTAQFQTSIHRMVQQAIEKNLVVAKTGYRVSDTVSGTVFGRNGNEVFNHVYSVGVSCSEGIWFPQYTFMPWLVDSDFVQLRNQYKPIRYGFAIRNVTSDTMYGDTLNVMKLKKTHFNDESFALSEIEYENSLQIDESQDIVNGWLVWVYTSDSADIVSSPSFAVVSHNTDVRKKNKVSAPIFSFLSEDSIGKRRLIGGIYVSAHISNANIAFRLAGLLIRDGDSWKISPAFSKGKTTHSLEASGTLTPVETTSPKDNGKATKKKSKKK